MYREVGLEKRRTHYINAHQNWTFFAPHQTLFSTAIDTTENPLYYQMNHHKTPILSDNHRPSRLTFPLALPLPFLPRPEMSVVPSKSLSPLLFLDFRLPLPLPFAFAGLFLPWRLGFEMSVVQPSSPSSVLTLCFCCLLLPLLILLFLLALPFTFMLMLVVPLSEGGSTSLPFFSSCPLSFRLPETRS